MINEKIKRINKGNKLIADFMGVYWNDCDENYYSNCYLLDEAMDTIENDFTPNDTLKFHRDWNWLMPVVIKCFEKWEFRKNKEQNRFVGYYKNKIGSLDEYHISVGIGSSGIDYIGGCYNAVLKYLENEKETN
jgi:hypothetical protein